MVPWKMGVPPIIGYKHSHPILPPIFHYIYLGEEKEYPAKETRENRDNKINQWSWDTLPINKFW